MPGGIKKIKIFLASSNELKEDRKEFNRFIGELNTRNIDEGFYLEIIHWEHFLDAISETRLQDEYNNKIRKADIVLCLFFTKVGTFSAEEFNTAYTTFKATGKPRIWTYFKDAPILPSTVTTEFNTILVFKEKLKALGHFISQYDSTPDLHLKFREQLDIFLPECLASAHLDQQDNEAVPDEEVPEAPVSNQLSKMQLFELIDTDLGKTFEALRDIYSDSNAKLNDLYKKYTERVNDNEIGVFKSDLKRFVSRQPDSVPKEKVNKEFNESLYNALCELDFKTQTAHFEIYKHKKIAPFLLYGQHNEEGSELEWFYKQLMNKGRFLNDTPLIVDMASKMGGSFDRLLDAFYTRFNIYEIAADDDELFAVLKDEIQKRLTADHIVCLIKNAGNMLANPLELNKVFNDFLVFMQKNIVRGGHNHSLIFLFMQDTLPVELCRDEACFLWFDKLNNLDYPLYAYQCRDLKIFDLAPIRTLNETDIVNWFKWAMTNSPALFEAIAPRLIGKEQHILGKEGRPLAVINNICSEFNVKLSDLYG